MKVAVFLIIDLTGTALPDLTWMTKIFTPIGKTLLARLHGRCVVLKQMLSFLSQHCLSAVVTARRSRWPCPCVGSLQLLRLPPTVQTRIKEYGNWLFEIDLEVVKDTLLRGSCTVHFCSFGLWSFPSNDLLSYRSKTSNRVTPWNTLHALLEDNKKSLEKDKLQSSAQINTCLCQLLFNLQWNIQRFANAEQRKKQTLKSNQ